MSTMPTMSTMSTMPPMSTTMSMSTTTFETSVQTTSLTDFSSFNHGLMRSYKQSFRRVYKLIAMKQPDQQLCSIAYAFIGSSFQSITRRSTILQSLIRQKRRRQRNRRPNPSKPTFPVYDDIPIYDPEIHGSKPRESSSPGECGLLSVPKTSYRITNHSKRGRCLDCDSHRITINKPFDSSLRKMNSLHD